MATKHNLTGAARYYCGLLLPLAAALVVASCANKNGVTTSATGSGGDPALVAAGKTVFDANNCTNCHTVGGQGRGRGPDLTHTGANPAHSPEWLADHVKNPKKHNPGSRMPGYEGRISDKDLQALGAYLASLK